MAISVDWPAAVVLIPKADTVLVGTDPISGREIRSFDTDAFHEELREQEESEAGRAYPITHLWNAEVSLGGVNYNPQFLTVNNYQFEFEDGTYRVVFTNTNNDIADFSVVNNVSIQPGNSAGLQKVSTGGGLSPGEQGQLADVYHIIKGKNVINRGTGLMEVYNADTGVLLYTAPIYEDKDGTTPVGPNSVKIDRRNRFN